MTQEEKSLLLQELCTRLSYGVKVTWDGKHPLTVTPHIYCAIASEDNINNLPKLLLRPMSSMTKEELHEVQEILGKGVEIRDIFIFIVDSSINTFSYLELQAVFDWFNAHHFDYRGLIEKGLALEAPENIYIDRNDGNYYLTNPNGNSIEYTRTDAFIEKALAYLNSKFYFHNAFYGVVSTDFNAMEEMFEDFRKYIEEE